MGFQHWMRVVRNDSVVRICEAREDEIIKTTQQLVDIIGKGRKRHRHKKSIHPATRVFQVGPVRPFDFNFRIGIEDSSQR